MKPTCGAGQSWKHNLLQSLFFPIFSQDRSGDGKDDAPGSRRWLWKQFKMSEYTSQQKQLFLLQVRWGQPQCWCWGDFCPQKWFAVSQERLHTAGRAGDCEQLWHPALLYLIQQQCLESKELFTILPGLTFLLAGLDTLTRASDVFSIGKALKRSRIAAPCSKPPFRRNLTNTGKFLPQTVVVRGEFIDSLIICFNIYCGFILKYLLFFLICALPTNIAVKKPSIMVRSALQGSREEQQMLQWHSLGVFFGY